MKSILGIGNALTDILAVLPDDSLLKKYNLPLGSMQHVDAKTGNTIWNDLKEIGVQYVAGGSAANTVSATAITANEVAAQNRLTVTVRVNFTNRKHSEDDFENQTFSAYADYDSTNSLDAVESSLCTEIIDKLIEDIFNATVAQW